MHAIHWFEIPTTDMARAKAFYSAVLNITEYQHYQAGPSEMAIFPYDPAANGVGGGLIHGGPHRPSAGGATGVVVYLNAGQDLAGAVERAVKAGGTIRQPITDIGDPGKIALIQDSEGNIVGLHQPRPGQRA